MIGERVAVTVDRAACMGHARCVAAAPALFDIADDGTSRVLVPVLGRDFVALARRAARVCPERAIHVEERHQ